MFKNMKALPKAIILGVAVVGVLFAGKAAMQTELVSKYTAAKPTVPIAVPDSIQIAPSTAAPIVATTSITASATGSVRVNTIPWNGTAGMHYAKAAGLFKARGLDVTVTREDDYSKMIANMAAFAKNNDQGVHFTVIMGDGLPAYIIGLNAALKPFSGSAAMIAGIGYSRGEDKCIIDSEAEVRGSLIAGYLGDGDINICIKYAGDNGIPVNADPKVYDPNAMNFLGTGSFVEADEKFIASAKTGFKGGACEERSVVGGGRKSVCVNGTATWTPGDSKVFSEMKKLGRSIKIIGSTKEYMWQMPTAVIGNKQWMDKNPEVVKAFLAATFEGGEKVRSDNAALMVASAEQAKVYGEQDASYWASMFKGVNEVGPNGKTISLGGSTTNGIADAAFLFGLNGADDLFKKVYSVYGKIAVQYFPDIMPGGLQSYEAVVDKKFVQALLASSTNVAAADTTKFTGASTETFSSKSVSIEFETGKATFTAKAAAALNQVMDDAAVTGLSVQINGHTDNVGNPDSNLTLSKARAEAVKRFLMTNAPTTFPADRVQTRGFGDTQPIGTNAQNRRVEILLRK